MVIRVLMLLSLWNGPIPLGHDHRSMMNGIAGAASVAKHVASFHSNCKCGASKELGWHLHWIMPNCENEGFDDCVAANSWIHSRIAETQTHDGLLVLGGPSAEPDHWLSRGIFLHFQRAGGIETPSLATSKLSLPEVLGIMRC
jgi:hypothetical protein